MFLNRQRCAAHTYISITSRVSGSSDPHSLKNPDHRVLPENYPAATTASPFYLTSFLRTRPEPCV